MKGFRFTLDAVRKLRERQEQAAVEHYAQALLHRLQAAQALEAAEETLVRAHTDWRRKVTSGCPVSEIQQLQSHYGKLVSARDHCALAMTEAECALNLSLQSLREARQAVEVIEKAYESQRREYLANLAHSEGKALDDLRRRPSASDLFIASNPA